ncbi:MAG: SRPBCC family protein [Verrucomicrobiae bacterium]|nr:SRPBCC family protein [Verrucomicrobiae bacterium]
MFPVKIHRFEQTQILPVSLDEAWSFFSDPRNLDGMTPPELAFRTESGDDEPMFAGQMIVHCIQILPKIWTTWLTEIVEVVDREYFIDEQRTGPYRLWHHLHRFEPCAEGVRMLDRVHYALPCHPFSAPAHRFFVRPQLEYIFGYRRRVLEERFSGEVAEK